MKKAQIQIQETILVLFIFFVILGILLILFYQFNIRSINTNSLRYETTRFSELLSVIPNLPELKCSSLTTEQECIDTLKLLSFNPDYNFGFKEINVYYQNINDTCNFDSYPNCNNFNIYSRGKQGSTAIISSPISLYFPLEDEHKLGILEIKWYY